MSAVALIAACAGACGPSGTTEEPPPAPEPCSDVSVERYKELIVVDDAVLEDARAKNATDGVWSFRHAMENMAPSGLDPSEFTLKWLQSWVDVDKVNGYAVDKPVEGRERAEGMRREIICPWLKRRPENGCADADVLCGQCAERKLDLALAPFRLIAIVNRLDLRAEVAGEPSGEGRLVFATVKGLGDDPAAEVTPTVLIFEYRHPDTRSLPEWAKAWHALGQFAAFDEPYRAALEGVTNGFTKRGANPTGTNGSAIAQVRTNDQFLHWRWQMREFGLDAGGALAPRPLRNTPPEELNNSVALGNFLVDNAAAVRSNSFELPAAMRGASTTLIDKPWSAPGIDEATRKAFARNTCNGCHSTEEATVPPDSRFHISPFKRGIEKLSPFMVTDQPNKPSDVTLRAASMQRALCEQ